ncbi:MAG: PTS sugar transporter subunit IIA [Verrucomicrobiae bacterium]|nr:PTS sugar transporter subunit IIA [Verrucomicrobiae bacterium]
MTLASLLTPDRVLASMEATEHWPAIVELVDQLVATGNYPETGRETILASLHDREEQRSTGIGGGIAIPHAFSDDIEEVTAIFGRSAGGIDFGAIDNAAVHYIVLFLVPREQYTLHLRTLAAIAKILNNGNVRNQLAEAADITEILDVLALKTTPRV